MKQFFTTKRVCRAGVICALYVALTLSFGALSFQGFIQIRPAEALCLLPLLFPEAIPALFLGCVLSNAFSLYGIYDVVFGSFATLLSALCTYSVSRIFANKPLKIALGGLFPVLLNALIVPIFAVITTGNQAYYLLSFASMAISQAIWIYALGSPLYLLLSRLERKNILNRKK